ncbi:MAG: hypothetical protein ACFNQG_07550, partial [Treponema socranskii subsp. buccale]
TRFFQRSDFRNSMFRLNKKEPVREMHIGSNAHQAIGDMGGRGNVPDIYNIDLNAEKEQRI